MVWSRKLQPSQRHTRESVGEGVQQRRRDTEGQRSFRTITAWLYFAQSMHVSAVGTASSRC